MLRAFSSKVIFTLLFFSVLFLPARSAFADFKLIDAIQEFGEKRFVKPKPARLRLGPARFHPSIRTKTTLDDNILLEDEDGRGDIVYNIQPGVIVEVPINTHQVVVGYEADIEVFSKSRHAKQTDQNQNFFTLIDIKFPSWYINVLERFSETSGRSGTTFTGRIPRMDNQIHPKIGVRWNKFILEAGFRHTLRDFRRQVDDSLQFQVVEWTGVLFYEIFSRLKALVDTSVSQIDYDDNFQRNGTFTQFRFGIVGEPIPNLVTEARLGVQFRNYEVNSKPDFNSWVGALKLDYLVRDNIRLKLSAERIPLEATFGNVNFLKRHIIRTGFEYDFGAKWTVFQNFKYYRDAYAERATVVTRSGFRRDNHIAYESGIRYRPLEWWEIEFSYEFIHRNSNFNTFDYSNNRLSLTSTLSY